MLTAKCFNLLIFLGLANKLAYGQVYPYQDAAAPAYQYPEGNQMPNIGFPQDSNLGFPQDPGLAYAQDPGVQYAQDPNSMVYQDSNNAYQDPNMVYQNPNMVYQDPNMVNQDPNMMYQDPNMVYQNPNMVNQDPNMMYQDPNMVYQDPNMAYQDPNMVYQDPNMVNQPVLQPNGQQNGLYQPEPYPYQDFGMAQQQPSQSGWYIPPGAVPNGFELDDTQNTNDGSLNDPGAYMDNDFEDIDFEESSNPELSWQNPVDYYPAGFAPQEMQYDYNNYYSGPCMEPPIIWDNGCGGGGGEVPYCDQATCTQNCLQFMNSAKGVCIDYECFCEKTDVTEKPKPEQDWNHDNQNEWPEKYPNCGKPNQSPKCNLDEKTEMDLSRKITFDYYKEPFGLIVENTGHGVRIYVQGEEKLPALDLKGVQLEGNDMSGRFTLSHIDLHWSRTEHCVDGLRGDLEMQLNHFDLSFEDYDEASKIPGATIALGLLLEVHTNETDLCKAVSTAMKSIVKPNGAGETIGSMAHLKFIPEGIGMDFYLYEGSQTEPPCRPQNWLISKTKFKVLESQIEEMKEIHDILGNPILNNVRDDQTS